MKSILLLVCLITGFTVFAQNSEREVYLFASDNLVLKELDYDFYKKYLIINKAEKDAVLRSFIVYNDETPEFKTRFISSRDTINKSIGSNFSKEEFSRQAETAYQRLRLMETLKKLNVEENFEPKAGSLLVATDVDVQRVDKGMKRQVKRTMKEKMKQLRKDGNFSIEPYLIKNTWILVEISKNKSGKNKYKEELYSTDSKGVKSKTAGENGSTNSRGNNNMPKAGSTDATDSKASNEEIPSSTKYYKNKKRVKYRLVELIADSIKSQQNDALIKLKHKTDSSLITLNSDRERAIKVTDSISNFDNEINVLEKQLKVVESEIESEDQQKIVIETYRTDVLNKLNNLVDYEKLLLDFTAVNFTETSNDKIFSFTNSIHKLLSHYDDSVWKLNFEIGKKKIEIDSINYHNKENEVKNEVKFKLLELQSDSALLATKISRLEKESRTLEEIADELTKIISLKIKAKDKDKLKADKQNIENLINTQVADRSAAFKRKTSLNETISKQENLNQQYKRSLNEINRNLFHDSLKIDSLQIEFNDGSIENIQVNGNLAFTGKVLKFSNVGPIGFTSKTEIEALNSRWLFANPGDDVVYSINAGKVIKDYYEKYEVDRRDYSPRNQTIIISRKYDTPRIQNPSVLNSTDVNSSRDSVFVKDVFKEYSSDIITGTVFTDVNGLNGDEPNGIIQTEFYKEMAIFKHRFNFNRPMYNTKSINLNVNKKSDFSFGIASYIKPHFVVSKIESENKNLELSQKQLTINNQTDDVFYASTVDLRKHETFRVGLTFNTFTFDFPSAKTTIFLDYSVYGALIPVIKPEMESEPAPEKFSANALEHGAIFAAEFFTDERYGLKVSGGFNAYHVYNDQFVQVGDPREFKTSSDTEDLTKGRSIYWRANLLAYLKPDRDGKGKIFFRYNYFMPHNHADLSWSQIQFGYAFSITKKELPQSLK